MRARHSWPVSIAVAERGRIGGELAGRARAELELNSRPEPRDAHVVGIETGAENDVVLRGVFAATLPWTCAAIARATARGTPIGTTLVVVPTNGCG